MFLPFIGPLIGIAGEIIKRIAPEKMSELEKAQLAQALQLEMMKQDWSAVEKEYQDRADARALAKADVDKGNWFSNILAATIRPLWGYWSMAVVTILVIGKSIHVIEPPGEVLDMVKGIVQSVIMFYFGGRIIEKVADKFATGWKKP